MTDTDRQARQTHLSTVGTDCRQDARPAQPREQLNARQTETAEQPQRTDHLELTDRFGDTLHLQLHADGTLSVIATQGTASEVALHHGQVNLLRDWLNREHDQCHVEIGGQRMTQAQYDAATFPYRKPDAPETDTDETVTAEAERHVYGNRGQDYGHPREHFTRTAILWSGLLHHKLSDGEYLEAEDVARLFIADKLSRDVNHAKRDNRVDIAGYALTLDRLETGQ